MSEIDSTQEWHRLQKAYADMTEEELQAVADDGFELTDLAKQALRAEISNRGLQVVVRLAPPADDEPIPERSTGHFDPADLDLAVALSVENRAEADHVRTTLHGVGIPCFFGPDLTEDVDRLQFPEYGVAVRVLASDVERTRYLLKDFLAELRNEDEKLPDLRCPKCHSPEIMLQSLDSGADEVRGDSDEDQEPADHSDQDEPPASSASFHWSCDACGYQWTDDGIET